MKGGIYAPVPDVDEHDARTGAAGAEVLRELRHTEHASREYVVGDLEGQVWSFATDRPASPPL